MLNYMLQRVTQALLVVMIVSIVVFLIMYLVPGDTVTVLAGPDPSPEVVAALRERFGLDQPLPVQYAKWAWHAVQGDLGTSHILGRPVSELILSRLGATLELAIAAILLASLFGVAVGIVAALNQGRWIDSSITVVNSFVLSVPNFWFGIVGILCFAVWLGWLPSGGRESFIQAPVDALRHLVLPAIALALDSIAMIARLVRASLLDELSRDYVTVARAKGVGPAWLMRRHIARQCGHSGFDRVGSAVRTDARRGDPDRSGVQLAGPRAAHRGSHQQPRHGSRAGHSDVLRLDLYVREPSRRSVLRCVRSAGAVARPEEGGVIWKLSPTYGTTAEAASG